MSDLGFLKKLLDAAEVEWLPLGKLGAFIRGNGLQKKDLVEVGSPAIHYGQIYTKYDLEARETYSYVAAELFRKLRKAKANDLLLATTSENDEDVVKPLAWYGANVAISGDMMLFRHRQNAKYLAHFLLTETFQKQKGKYITGTKIRRVSSGDLAKLEVPIPCPDDPEKSLAIQGEIVRILDTFTELIAELIAELAARKKQYNHYRDQLLTFEDGEVEWMALGDLTRIKTGQSVNKNMIAENPGQYPVINSGRDPLGFLDDWNTEGDPIGITSRGAGVGSVTWQEGRYFRGNLNYSVTTKSVDDLNVHYLYHILEQFQPKIKELCTFDGIPALNAVNLKKLSIPVPALAEQARIATILDNFDTLTTSLSEGLPREIALRQQQYEYYRDLLLSFPKPAEAAEA